MIRFNGGLRRPARFVAAATMLLALMLLAGCASGGSQTLAVNAVMADPAAYSGQIAVRGVVQKVDTKNSSVTLIDETEYATCGLTPCNSAGLLLLPLPIGAGAPSGGPAYQGELPALEDVVVVTGEIKSGANGKYFDVERVERNGSVLVSKN